MDDNISDINLILGNQLKYKLNSRSFRDYEGSKLTYELYAITNSIIDSNTG